MKRTPPTTLNLDLLEEVKKAFVPMPGGQAEPVAGAGMMTAAQAAPMGPPPGAPMDPAMGGAPMDPAAMGGAPMDPAAMGGMPPMDPAAMGGMPPMDPAAMGMDPAMLAQAVGGEAGPSDGTITMPVSQLLELIAVLTGGQVAKANSEGSGEGGEMGAKPKKPSSNQMLQEIHGMLTGGAPQQ